MCFGPKRVEQQPAVAQRQEADIQKREVVEERAEQKVEDIEEAVESKAKKSKIRGMRGGPGRRSLFRAGGGGFLGRFG